jgi:hypothetical protein
MQIEELNSKLGGLLPPPLQPYCQVGSFTNGCLTLIVADAIWASQLRYFLPELRDKLRSQAGLYQLGSIKMNIVAEQRLERPRATPKLELSETARSVIHSAGALCDYLPLKEAMQRLSNTKR